MFKSSHFDIVGWQVLGDGSINLQSSFFACGGDSVTALRCAAVARQRGPGILELRSNIKWVLYPNMEVGTDISEHCLCQLLDYIICVYIYIAYKFMYVSILFIYVHHVLLIMMLNFEYRFQPGLTWKLCWRLNISALSLLSAKTLAQAAEVGGSNMDDFICRVHCKVCCKFHWN